MAKKYDGRIDLIMFGFKTSNRPPSYFRLSIVLEQNIVSQLVCSFESANGIQRLPLGDLKVGVPLAEIGDIDGYVRGAASQMGLGFDNSIKEHIVIGAGNFVGFKYLIKDKRCCDYEAAIAVRKLGYPAVNPNRVTCSRLREANSVVEMLKASSRLLERNSGYAFYK